MREATPNNGLLRLMTCGSVDDGKSTLIGRLLFDTDAVFEDHMAALTRDSQRFGTTGDNPDLALLMDGLQAEREQGITIDVAYRYFSTRQRSFIVADTPGHEQYTRNMATGASTSDLAVILVDARKGMLTQTHRHSLIVSLMGIRHVVLAISKMDLVDYDKVHFETICAAYAAFSQPLGFASIVPIPIAAVTGANIVHRSTEMAWYEGPTLLQHLETVDVTRENAADFRMPVQWVCRHDTDFRGYAGTVASGSIAPGTEITVLPRGSRTRITRIVTQDGDLATAQGGDAITLILADDIDIARGDMIVAGEPPHNADQFSANLIWMGEAPLLSGRPYLIQFATASATATVTEIKHGIDVNTGAHVAARQLAMNESGVVNVALDHPLPFDSYQDNRATGAFILIDRISNDTVGAGMIRFPLRRAANLSWQKLSIDKAARANLKRQRPAVLWFTGLSGSGKSTIADGLEKALLARGYHTYVLDGDNIRHGLNKDLGFTDTDRVENIRRVAEVAALFADAGLLVLVSFISPFRNERQFARERVGADEFFEIFVDAPLEECERRDPKGLYRKARQGAIVNFTGVDSSYEPPEHPDIHLQTKTMPPEEAVEMVLRHLREHKIIV